MQYHSGKGIETDNRLVRRCFPSSRGFLSIVSLRVLKWHLKRMIRDGLPHSLSEQLLGQPDALYHLWSIGLYEGTTPYTLKPARGIENPVLTRDYVSDARALFVADPFMISCDRFLEPGDPVRQLLQLLLDPCVAVAGSLLGHTPQTFDQCHGVTKP